MSTDTAAPADASTQVVRSVGLHGLKCVKPRRCRAISTATPPTGAFSVGVTVLATTTSGHEAPNWLLPAKYPLCGIALDLLQILHRRDVAEALLRRQLEALGKEHQS
jgi:hypothetical protein